MPAAGVVDVARQCAAKGVRGLIVISAGFGETGPEGLARQHDLLEVCRASGMRLIGPNCMGIVNTDPELVLNGTFSTAWPPTGRVGFLSQSGALGLAVMGQAAALGLGLSTFVSVGNKADVSGNDLLCYWEQDDRTDLVLLYLESFGNPRRFGRLARRIGRTKPVVVVKSGRSVAGQRAASSHTGALLAASDTTVDALFRQHGVIRTDTLEEMFDVATLLANQPVPAGKRVAIVTNAGGLGHPVRRHVRGERPVGARARDRDGGRARGVPPRRGLALESRGHDRLGHARRTTDGRSARSPTIRTSTR